MAFEKTEVEVKRIVDPVENREKQKYLIFLLRVYCVIDSVMSLDLTAVLENAARRGRTKQKLKTTGPKVSKIEQAGRRSRVGKERKIGKVETGKWVRLIFFS